MPFTRFVEVGRVVMINYGPMAGSIATIIDIVDGKRVLVDGPQSITGIHRQVIGVRCIALTDVVVKKLPRNATQKNLTKAWTEQNTMAAWKATTWSKKVDAKAARKNLGDFGRFKVMIAKKQKSKIIADKLATM
ncbi:ribosomal protein L14-domain-containing protein [Ochromonadaceae sp. CCMP2298]|nr:ribosomal protein L14-domain-containing protein [Ochromonadaceae sp. CCMP2298]|mmetsp:Transcript_18892/g.42074  ORF Transcript_18892/g.42074 Transcript_18892/m.42074 type:complete len:134 (+) Transcript_18892:77-478(+)|eukprot:CAMPEP_0173212928 /NCGR_PEP_ID=MMETSP1141-20130122/25091_1 /TAXON_ID=483371 /ORGANISM="non described non described, Strain CCMP2298" /LENGTH=133 /DNA_ID=CAMNT_0014140039 /DNA_START=76 /DNA_END=477 /DNA_ORIENTATION=+